MSKKVLDFNSLTHTRGGKFLYSDISGEIYTGQKIAIIGQNGTGKTTLLQIFLNEVKPNQGAVNLRTANYEYLSQEDVVSIAKDDISILEAALYAAGFYEVYEQLKSSEYEVSQGSEGANDRYIDVLTEFQEKGGYGVIAAINQHFKISGINADDADYLLFSELSEGQKRLVYLIGLIVNEPELLILDEPTNHVDYELKQKYIQIINSIPSAILMVSHDRELLDKAADTIWALDYGFLHKYAGNWTAYEQEHRKTVEAAVKHRAKVEKKVSQFEQVKEKLQVLGRRGIDISTELKAVKTKIARLEDELTVIAPSTDKKAVSAMLESKKKMAQFPLRIYIDSLKVGGEILVENKDIILEKEGIYALRGRNGTGKSTIFKLVMGEGGYADFEGKIDKPSSTDIGYFNQKLTFPNPKETLINYFMDLAGGSLGKGYGLLFKYLFEKHQADQTLSSLSGGEKNRLQFAQIIEDEHNFLLLDEPTNHLDLPAIEALEEILLGYEGTIFYISHDHYFLKENTHEIFI